MSGRGPRSELSRRWRVPLAALGFLAGEARAGAVGVGAALALAAPALALWRRDWGVAAAVVGVAFVAGSLWRAPPWARSAAPLPGAVQRYRGVVEDEAGFSDRRRRPGQELTIRLERPLPEASGLAAGERVLVRVWNVRRALRPGDRVEFVARLLRPRGLCNGGRDAWARRLAARAVAAVGSVSDGRVLSRLGRIPGWPGAKVLRSRWRERARERIEAVVAPGPAGLLRALALGDRRAVDEATRAALIRSGTGHLLAVSGLHVALLAGWILAAASLLARRLAAWSAARGRAWPRPPGPLPGAAAALIAVAAYAWLVGLRPSTVRAAVMAAVAVGGLALGRPLHVPTGLAMAAIAVGLLDPDAPFDVSAQLSFAAVLALWVGWRTIGPTAAGRWLRRASRGSPISRAAAAAASAAVASALVLAGVAPLLVRAFGRLSLLGLLANPVVVPLLGAVALPAALAGVLVAPLCPAASGPPLRVAGAAAAIALRAAGLIAALPGGDLRPAPLMAALGPSLLGLLALGFQTRSGIRLHVAVGLAAALAVLAFGRPAPARGLRVSFLDVGQGDAALVSLPGARLALLVDAGGFPGGGTPARSVLLPALRREAGGSLAGVLVSHPQWDHFGGLLDLLEETRPGAVWWSGRESRTPGWRELERELSVRGVPLVTVLPGALPGVEAGGRVELRVLHPPAGEGGLSTNDASVVLRVGFGAVRFLFTGDVEAAAERELALREAEVASTVLKVPHHGSRTSSGAELVAAVRPALAVASLGAGNRFRFPAAAVVRRYRAVGGAWLSTAERGEVSAWTDGQLVAIRTCR